MYFVWRNVITTNFTHEPCRTVLMTTWILLFSWQLVQWGIVCWKNPACPFYHFYANTTEVLRISILRTCWDTLASMKPIIWKFRIQMWYWHLTLRNWLYTNTWQCPSLQVCVRRDMTNDDQSSVNAHSNAMLSPKNISAVSTNLHWNLCHVQYEIK